MDEFCEEKCRYEFVFSDINCQLKDISNDEGSTFLKNSKSRKKSVKWYMAWSLLFRWDWFFFFFFTKWVTRFSVYYSLLALVHILLLLAEFIISLLKISFYLWSYHAIGTLTVLLRTMNQWMSETNYVIQVNHMPLSHNNVEYSKNIFSCYCTFSLSYSLCIHMFVLTIYP